MGYYKQIDGKKYDGELLDAAQKAVEGKGDGRISKADAEMLLKLVKDGDAYTDVEKDTVAYIREHMKWTDEADAWFRAEIQQWAAERAAKTRADNAAGPKTEEEVRTFIDEVLAAARHERDQWDDAFGKLRTLLEGPMKSAARDLLGQAAKRERLEFQWKLDGLLEETAPPEPPKPEPKKPEPEPEAAEEPELIGNPPPQPPGMGGGMGAPQQLRPEDLVPIYDDPRGLMIHRHKTDGRWFLTQIDPRTGQPQTILLAEDQKKQVETELAGSPYWLEKSW